ncbi:MAG: hypothetical protein EPN94_05725 [Nitrospirae bacterium]|nr:MAG: hypothetical protein EPN94_05725 [Nitrospirota bacterium]
MNHRILNSETGSVVEFDVFCGALKFKGIIYIGEFHQIPEVSAFQADLILRLINEGFKPAIGLEMFNVLQQEMLDYYIAGAIPFEQLSSLYAMGPEGFDLNHYIKIIEIAVKNRLKVFGLNIPRSIASAVAKHGLDKRELECFRLDEEKIKNCGKRYREALSGIYKKHPHDEITEENFILAQSLKDEMMAETIAHQLAAGTAGRPFIGIAGRGHIEYGLGIPERVRRKLPEPLSAASVVVSYEDEKIETGMADYILLI